VDLERNDLGKVCRYGSVRVDEFMTIEQYSHVSHLVSDVVGTLQPGVSPLDLVKAVFPGGTITGVPKLRCMENHRRTGAGAARTLHGGRWVYFSWNGDLDLNILIRTLVLTKNRGYLQVGAGIVADSDPDREYDETLAKAGAFFKILEGWPLMWVFLNDRFVRKEEALVSVFDHGFLYGDGVYETLRSYGTRIFMRDQHLARLRRSARSHRPGHSYPGVALAGVAHEAMRRNGVGNEQTDAYLRITVSRGAGEIGLDPGSVPAGHGGHHGKAAPPPLLPYSHAMVCR
jgi:hypothetical protein